MTAVGIDLGTTNSCIAVWRKAGVVEVIKDIEGALVTPSMVAVKDNGEVLVGWPAKREAELNPEHTYRSVKRLIGRAFTEDETAQMATKSPFAIARADNGEAWIQGRDNPMPPAQISGMVMTRLKKAAERALGREVTKAVITVPAFFNDAQRRATRDAAGIAGIEVLRIVNEPTAAALAADIDARDGRTVAVYDLGGGTFDLSVLRAESGQFEVLSTNGDTFLGGDDFDARLIDWVAERFLADHGVDLREGKVSLQRLADEAERVKRALSESDRVQFSIPYAALEPVKPGADGRPHIDLDLEITREQFDGLTADLVARTIDCCEAALADAGIAPGDVDELLLVGGMTRAPAVLEAATTYFGGVPWRAPDPDQIVARGAAILAAALTGQLDIELVDVTPHPIGIETADHSMAVLIPAQTKIPCQVKRACTTQVDSQEAVTVRLRQGGAELAADNLALGQFHLEGIGARPAGAARVDVTIDIDVDGIVTASAKDRATGRSNNITAEAAGLAPKAVERMAKAARSVRGEAA
ncbi:Hsp70 family protein [Vitreimonas flagellata]|uniref:Hsp70 family protein n=1 Tax=Vitreimonas flagellata TaxID=2560861 RepID=UPI001074AE5A|nr:Hsp70 family protein [Vitreimonas flagellata]